ncbi:MAG: rhomboid family intramembrane serine protease [Chthoniobacteraceae bacterium]
MIPLYDDNPTHRVPVFTFVIIAINVLVFFGWQFSDLEGSVMAAAFVPAELTTNAVGSSKYLITSMFMHGGLMHLIGNMWFLWIFGDNVENATGSIRFVVFYVLTGVLATLAHVAFDPQSEVPLVGASGAISGVLGAYLVKHPKAPIRTLIPLGIFTRIVDIPAWVFLFVWIGIQVVSQAAMSGGEGGGGVAYLAHIGGFVAGVVLIFVFQTRDARSIERVPRGR